MERKGREGRALSRPLREGRVPMRPLSIAARLKRLSQLLAKGLIAEEEFQSHRTRILGEM